MESSDRGLTMVGPVLTIVIGVLIIAILLLVDNVHHRRYNLEKMRMEQEHEMFQEVDEDD